MGMMRHTISFIGHVQGVGFRYRTVSIAAVHDVAGWVRNEPDGSVLCVVEGESGELARFLAAIRQAMAGHIRGVRIDESPATGEFKVFEVRR